MCPGPWPFVRVRGLWCPDPGPRAQVGVMIVMITMITLMMMMIFVVISNMIVIMWMMMIVGAIVLTITSHRRDRETSICI